MLYLKSLAFAMFISGSEYSAPEMDQYDYLHTQIHNHCVSESESMPNVKTLEGKVYLYMLCLSYEYEQQSKRYTAE